LKLIAAGERTKEEVLKECLKEMRNIFKEVEVKAGEMRNYLEEN
jgi:hypothetical protein